MAHDALDAEAVRRWLDARGVDVAGPLAVSLVSGGRSNPTYLLGDGEREWVLRRPPHGHVLPTAHDMGREHRVMSALAGTDVPVPRMVGLCEDTDVIGASFYVMAKVDGTTLRTRDDTERLTPEQRGRLAENLVDVLVALHRVEPDEVGLGDWGRPDGYLERQLSRWSQQWEASATRERPEVARLLDVLGATLPDSGRPGVVHGDYKLDNVMVDTDDPTRVVGLLDWEMSTRGDTATDVGLLCSFWDHEDEPHNPITAGATALPGFPRRDDVVARYAAARGTDVDDLTWYVVFADLKIAVILEGIHARHQQGHTEGEDFEGVGDMVGPLLDRALDRADALSVPTR